MSDPATPQQIIDAGADVLRTELDPDGLGRVDLTDGSDNTLLLSASAAMAMRNTSYLADRARARYRSSATGDDLAQVARDIYQTEYKPESFATIVVYLKRSLPVASTSIPKGSRFGVQASATQKAVQFAADHDIPATSSTAKVAVPLTCLTAGEIGNVDYSALTLIVDDLPDASWFIFTPSSPTDDDVLDGLTGPEGAAGGASAETDDEVSARLAQFPSTASRRPGTRSGILFGILETPGVRYCTLTNPGNGTLRAFVGDPQYGLNEALADKVRDNLESGAYSASGATGYQGMGIPIEVLPFTLVRVVITATIYMDRETFNYDIGALRSVAIANGTEYFAARTQGDEFRLNKIEAALEACHPETQDADVSLSPTQVLRVAPASYASATEIVRYYVDEQSWRLTFAGPKTQ